MAQAIFSIPIVLQHCSNNLSRMTCHSLLGTFGLRRDYIADYARIHALLINLLRSDVPWRWWEEVEVVALQKLKASIRVAPVSAKPDPESPFHVLSDASDYAVGSSLEQDTLAGRRPVAFSSHKLADRRYPVHEREPLAIVLALRLWRHYLYSSEFTITCSTDHRPLQHFMSQANLSTRHVRWPQFLSELNSSVEHVSGSVNSFVDGLSRRDDLRIMLVASFVPYATCLKLNRNFVPPKKVSASL